MADATSPLHAQTQDSGSADAASSLSQAASAKPGRYSGAFSVGMFLLVVLVLATVCAPQRGSQYRYDPPQDWARGVQALREIRLDLLRSRAVHEGQLAPITAGPFSDSADALDWDLAFFANALADEPFVVADYRVIAVDVASSHFVLALDPYPRTAVQPFDPSNAATRRPEHLGVYLIDQDANERFLGPPPATPVRDGEEPTWREIRPVLIDAARFYFALIRYRYAQEFDVSALRPGPIDEVAAAIGWSYQLASQPHTEAPTEASAAHAPGPPTSISLTAIDPATRDFVLTITIGPLRYEMTAEGGRYVTDSPGTHPAGVDGSVR